MGSFKYSELAGGTDDTDMFKQSSIIHMVVLNCHLIRNRSLYVTSGLLVLPERKSRNFTHDTGVKQVTS